MDFALLYEACQKVNARGHQTKWNTFKPRIAQIMGELSKTADRNGEVTYQNLGERVNTDHRRHLGIYLRGLTYYNYERDEPPLAVLVVKAGTRRPGAGFYDQIEELGIYNSNIESEDSVFDRLRREVYSFY